jgi:hypothetical protein
MTNCEVAFMWISFFVLCEAFGWIIIKMDRKKDKGRKNGQNEDE